jgi:hypothetical protein
MFACCGRPAAASFCDPFAYIVFNYARETIVKICSLGAACCARIARSSADQGAASRPYPCDACVAPLATAPMSQTGS